MANINKMALARMSKNNKVIGLLIAEFNKDQRTIQSWINTDNIILTTPKAIEVIKQATGMKENEIIYSNEQYLI